MKVQIVHFGIVHDMLHQSWKNINVVTNNECTRPLADLFESAKKMMKASKWISGTLSKVKLQHKDKNKSESFGKGQALTDLKRLTVPEYPSVSEQDHSAQCAAYHERQRRVSWHDDILFRQNGCVVR